jgi:hypothetical protein
MLDEEDYKKSRDCIETYQRVGCEDTETFGK